MEAMSTRVDGTRVGVSILAVQRFHWLTTIIHHIARHQVSPREVEEALESAPAVFLLEAAGPSFNPFYRVVGYTRKGRLLEVYGILFQASSLRNSWYTVTAFAARSYWRARYRAEKGLARRI